MGGLMFRFQIDGVAVECDTAEELFSVLGLTRPKAEKLPSNPQAASWAEAAKVAEEMGISKVEARKFLAEQRKKVPAKAREH